MTFLINLENTNAYCDAQSFGSLSKGFQGYLWNTSSKCLPELKAFENNYCLGKFSALRIAFQQIHQEKQILSTIL